MWTGQYKQFVRVEGNLLAYVAAGDPANPPLLMVHGWLSHAGVWRHMVDALCHTYYCIAVDLLGHGDSDKPADGDYRIAAQARRVLALADALGVQRFALAGHSMGGQIALYLAIHHPEGVERLISVSGVVTGKLSPYILTLLKPVFALGARWPGIWNLSRRAVRFPLYALIYDHPIYYRPVYIPAEHIDRRMALQRGMEIPAYRDLQAIAAVNLTADLKRISAPTLAIFGRYDNTVPPYHGWLTRQHIPGARLELLDECGHIPMIEQPAQTAALMQAFLSNHSGTP